MPIDLKTQLLLLKTLQDVDVSLHLIDTELTKISDKMATAMGDLNRTNMMIASKRAERQALEKRRKNDELDLDASNARLKDRETRLYAIKTNKEYQAAIKEIADAKQANKDREDVLLRLMEQIDTLNKEITQLSGALADKEKAFKEKEAEIRKGETELNLEREKLLSKRFDAEKGVDREVLSQYRFIQNRFSDAMALAINGVCSGCNKRIPPQLYIELQKWREIITCTNCHRMLFFQEAPAKT